MLLVYGLRSDPFNLLMVTFGSTALSKETGMGITHLGGAGHRSVG